MNKIGSAIAIYNSNGFERAYQSLCNNFKKYLSDEETEQLDKMDAAVKAKEDKVEKLFLKLAKNKSAFSVTLETKRNGLSNKLYRNALLDIGKDGKPVANSNMFGLLWQITEYQNIKVLVANDDRFEDDYSFKGLAKMIHEQCKDGWGKQHFIFLKKSVLDTYQKYFDVKSVYNLSDMIDAERARRKAERKNARTGERVEAADAKILILPTEYNKAVSYNEIVQKAAAEGKEIALSIRDASHRGDRDWYAVVNIPTTPAAEKTFTSNDVHLRSVNYGLRYLARTLGAFDKYLYVEVSPANYKRLKLWRDTQFRLEYDVVKSLLEEKAKSVKPVNLIKYSDKVLEYADMRDLQFTEEDKKTAFYKRFVAAVNVLQKNKDIVTSSDYEFFNQYRNSFMEFGVQSPLVEKESVCLFEDYPMLKYFGNTYNADVRLNSNLKEVMDYVRLVESAKAKSDKSND